MKKDQALADERYKSTIVRLHAKFAEQTNPWRGLNQEGTNTEEALFSIPHRCKTAPKTPAGNSMARIRSDVRKPNRIAKTLSTMALKDTQPMPYQFYRAPTLKNTSAY